MIFGPNSGLSFVRVCVCVCPARSEDSRFLVGVYLCVCHFVNDHLDAKHRNENLDLSVNYKLSVKRNTAPVELSDAKQQSSSL